MKLPLSFCLTQSVLFCAYVQSAKPWHNLFNWLASSSWVKLTQALNHCPDGAICPTLYIKKEKKKRKEGRTGHAKPDETLSSRLPLLASSRYLQRSHLITVITELLLVLHPVPLLPSLTVMWLSADPHKAGCGHVTPRMRRGGDASASTLVIFSLRGY